MAEESGRKFFKTRFTVQVITPDEPAKPESDISTLLNIASTCGVGSMVYDGTAEVSVQEVLCTTRLWYQDLSQLGLDPQGRDLERFPEEGLQLVAPIADEPEPHEPIECDTCHEVIGYQEKGDDSLEKALKARALFLAHRKEKHSGRGE